MTSNQRLLRAIFIIAGAINIILLLVGLATTAKSLSVLLKLSGGFGGLTLLTLILGLFQQVALACLFFWAAGRIKSFKG